MAKDPVCQMEVDEKNAPKAERHGQTYYFCSEHCRDKFMHEQKLPAEESRQPTAGYPSSR
jgi:YHS domain-containing protein